MTSIRAILALGMMIIVAAPQCAAALTLPEAIALAQRGNPGLAQSMAEADAASARLAIARAGRLPSLTVSGEAGRGNTNLGGFFGIGRSDVSPSVAEIELRQPLFNGGATSAAVDRAREGRDAALIQVGGAKALLKAQAADAYVAVLTAREIQVLHAAEVRQMSEIAAQADLRFTAGDSTRTDLAQAQARLAEARAGLVSSEGEIARTRAHFVSVVGVEPDSLDDLPAPPATPAAVAEAIVIAEQSNPTLLAAQAKARAAEAGVRFAQAERLPNIAMTATASSVRDQFFPNYRADGVTVGVQGRWTLFAGGAINGRIDEARADERGARAGLDAARAQVREAVIGAWQDLATARELVKAAADETAASAGALDSVRNEVRVGQKPTLDLLNAERDSVAAGSAFISAKGAAIVAAYRLDALLHAE